MLSKPRVVYSNENDIDFADNDTSNSHEVRTKELSKLNRHQIYHYRASIQLYFKNTIVSFTSKGTLELSQHAFLILINRIWANYSTKVQQNI